MDGHPVFIRTITLLPGHYLNYGLIRIPLLVSLILFLLVLAPASPEVNSRQSQGPNNRSYPDSLNNNNHSREDEDDHNYNYHENEIEDTDDHDEVKEEDPGCPVIVAQFNQSLHNSVRGDRALIFKFPVQLPLRLDLLKASISVEVSVHETTSLSCPVIFTIEHNDEVLHMQLPYVFRKKALKDDPFHNGKARPIYYRAARILCFKEESKHLVKSISVRVSTCSRTNVEFNLRAGLKFDMQLPTEKELTFEVEPTIPRYFRYVFEGDATMVRIFSTSDDSKCVTLSIQSPTCPVHDQQENVEFEGVWQTMSTKGAITVFKKDFPNGFFPTYVLHEDDKRCDVRNMESFMRQGQGQLSVNHTRRAKRINLSLRNERTASPGYYFLAMVLPVMFSLFLVLLACALFQNRHNWLSSAAAKSLHPKTDPITPMSPDSVLNNKILIRPHLLIHSMEVNPLLTPPSSIAESPSLSFSSSGGTPNSDRSFLPLTFEGDRHHGGFPTRKSEGRRYVAWRANLYLASLQKKEHREVVRDSRRFYWTIIIVSIFYAIPVYQLILHYLRVVNRMGEFDICYYNYLCAHRVWVFSDFNHFWSNISYVLFGIAFNFVVGRRERNLQLSPSSSSGPRRRRRVSHHQLQNGSLTISLSSGSGDDPSAKGRGSGGSNSSGRGRGGDDDHFCEFGSVIPDSCASCCCASNIYAQGHHGTPIHFGVFYAMGLALVMEGVLSAAYHLCPNQSNFQFDTNFMYVISVLTILKIYQFRHPVHIGANKTFAILAAFALVSVIGLILEVYDGGRLVSTFRWSFIVVQFLAMILIFMHNYAIGYIKDEHGNLITGIDIFLNLDQLPHVIQMDRLILPIISMSFSLGVAIYCEVENIHFATYLLYTLIANVLASKIYYIAIMKPLHGEFKNYTWVQPGLYFAMSGILGTIATQYFLSALTQWEVSPSASRASNEECTKAWFPFFPFYDNHDIWHFYSAGSLFCAFMGLLIVDDDLFTTPQKNIPIF